ncbi:tryptophan-rich sensory protein [Candidatus Woesearchaeota archaeon]|nr:tryptophan-rich sensory protein [Candidatus Woesearchaeota archaeon]
MLKSIPKLIASIIIPNLVGLIGSLFTRTGIDSWYSNITKPSFNPPNYVFGPVWTTLFVLMGISFYLIWTSGKNIKWAVIIFIVQLLLNTMWSILFFGLSNPMLAFIEIIILIAAIIANIIVFYRIRPAAAYLLIPYILWVSFAAVLNFRIWMLN